jgi:hypothetical protein
MKPWQIIATILILSAVSVVAFSPQVRAKLINKAETTMQFKTADWTTVDGAIEIITQTLEQDSPEQMAADLYSFMTEDVRDLFSLEDFKKGVFDTKMEVLRAEVLRENDEFAKVQMRLSADSQEKNFIVYLKKENGVWKLYATEEM